MKRVTSVRYHDRKTKRGIVPVRQHLRQLLGINPSTWKKVDYGFDRGKIQFLELEDLNEQERDELERAQNRWAGRVR